jgi:long-chain fatty acid transport protein
MNFTSKILFVLIVSATLASAASLQGLGAMGEELWPADAASIGRGMAGSGKLGEGFSVLNPARMAFETKTRFQATLEYQGVYGTTDGVSLGRDYLNLTSLGLCFPLGGYGALGFGMWQRATQNFSAVSIVDGEEVSSIDYKGTLTELIPAYAVRLGGSARFISLGAAWHFPMGRSTYTWKGKMDSTDIPGILVEDELVTQWGIGSSEGLAGLKYGYPAVSLQVHRQSWDYFLSGLRTHNLTRTLGRTQRLNLLDTLAVSKRHQTITVPWQIATGISLEPWKGQTISLEFSQSAGSDSVASGLDWLNFPSTFDLNQTPQLWAIGWQRDGSGVFYDSFVKKSIYRLGIWTRSWYLMGVQEIAGAAGIGMPLGKRGAKLDLGLYAGTRTFDGSVDQPESSESFWGVKVGFSGIGAWGQSARSRR